MSGSRTGGAKAAETNRKKYGADFYREIGRKGGKNGHTGGFYQNPEAARKAGAKGGRVSRRGVSTKHYEAKVMSFEQPVKKVGFLSRFKVGV